MVGSEVVSVSSIVADPCWPWPHGLQCVTACAVAIVPVYFDHVYVFLAGDSLLMY
jgi:hypothetical protein